MNKLMFKTIALLLIQAFCVNTLGMIPANAWHSPADSRYLSPALFIESRNIQSIYAINRYSEAPEEMRMQAERMRAEKDFIEQVLRPAVMQNRRVLIALPRQRYFLQSEKIGYPLGPSAIEGFCEESSYDLAWRISFLGGRDTVILFHAAEKLFMAPEGEDVPLQHFGHKFIIVVSPRGKNYLVDTTFIQFFETKDICAGQNLDVPQLLIEAQKEYPEMGEKIEKLLMDGFIELDERTANMYGCLLRGVYPFDKQFITADYLEKATLPTVTLCRQYIDLVNLQEKPRYKLTILATYDVPPPTTPQENLAFPLRADRDIDPSDIQGVLRDFGWLGTAMGERIDQAI